MYPIKQGGVSGTYWHFRDPWTFRLHRAKHFDALKGFFSCFRDKNFIGLNRGGLSCRNEQTNNKCVDVWSKFLTRWNFSTCHANEVRMTSNILLMTSLLEPFIWWHHFHIKLVQHIHCWQKKRKMMLIQSI